MNLPSGKSACAPATRAIGTNPSRLAGLDLARSIAFVGMVIVNFSVVMVPIGQPGQPASGLSHWLQGKAAASFVVLAGVGLGLGSAGQKVPRKRAVMCYRALFLLVVGLLNMMIFEADIIHFYAFYFFFGLFFLNLRSRCILFWIAALVIGYVPLALVLDYDAGWDWTTYSYRDFWSVGGFIRNLFFNGWHPVVPWLAFLLLGILLARVQLRDRVTQIRLVCIGGILLVVSTCVSMAVISAVERDDPEAALLFSTSPIPPFPLYMFAGGSSGSVLIGACLLLERFQRCRRLFAWMVPAGRQTLTLYLAHIVVGMSTLEAFGMLGNQSSGTALVAALVFCLVAILFAAAWSRFFQRGLIEQLMRSLAG